MTLQTALIGYLGAAPWPCPPLGHVDDAKRCRESRRERRRGRERRGKARLTELYWLGSKQLTGGGEVEAEEEGEEERLKEGNRSRREEAGKGREQMGKEEV